MISFHGAAPLVLHPEEAWGGRSAAIAHEPDVLMRLARWREELPKVDLAIVPSRYGAEELGRCLGMPPRGAVVAPHGVNRNVFHPLGVAVSGVGLLHVSSWQAKKNLMAVVEAYVALPEDSRPPLTIVCPGLGSSALPMVKGLSVSTKPRSATQLAGYYRGAIGLVFPSLVETFGMPVAEAMACGCPVITSTGSALEELFGDAALCVSPRDPKALSDAMGRVSADDELRERLSRKGQGVIRSLTWKASAATHRRAFEQALGIADPAPETVTAYRPADATVVLVIGMHRSGTSAVTGLLQRLGVDLGPHLLPAAQDNRMGFFEHRDIVAFHEDLLRALGSGWDDPAPLSDRWWQRDDMEGWRDRLRQILSRDFANSRLWAVKDPRLCRLLPLWEQVLTEMGVGTRVVFVLRSPQEVIDSLQARNAIAPDKGALLWLRHYLEAEARTRSWRRVVVGYPQVLTEWRSVVRRMGESLKLPLAHRIPKGVEDFLDRNLHHQKAGRRHHLPRPFDDWLRTVEEALDADPDNSDAFRALDAVSRQMNDFDESGAVYRAELNAVRCALRTTHGIAVAHREDAQRARTEINALRHTLQENQAEAARLREVMERHNEVAAQHEQRLQTLLQSRSWQLTRPLRDAGQHMRRVRRVFTAPRRVEMRPIADAKGDGAIGRYALQPSAQLPLGWVRFEARLDCGRGEQHSVAGRLMMEDAHRHETIVLPAPQGGRIGFVLWVASDAARFWYEGEAAASRLPLQAVQLKKSWRLSARKRVAHWVARTEQWLLPDMPVPTGARPGYRTFRYLAGRGLPVPPAVKARLRNPVLRLVGGAGDYADWVRRFATLEESDRERIRTALEAMPLRPRISILMPTYNTPALLLERAVGSVQRQLYPDWELCIADDASTDTAVRETLRRLAGADARIRLCLREENGHISAASNSALELATGDYVALLDHDDELSEDALYWMAEAINAHPETDVFYSDEDKVDQWGRRDGPYFKPDFSYELFLGQNLITHLGVYRTEAVRAVGGFRTGLEGAQDWDLALRVIERCGVNGVHHVPRILYHWRIHPGSTAMGEDEKPYAFLAQRKALEEHVARTRAPLEIIDHPVAPTTFHRPRWRLPEPAPLVSIIVPTRNAHEVLEACVSSVLERTTYPRFELLIVDNGSDDDEALRYLERLRQDGRVRVLRDERPFNYSALNNAAARQTRGDVLVLLNNDTEVITSSWLEELVSHAMRPEVGAVGARLLYPDGTVQHAGVVLGLGGAAAHSHRGSPREAYGHGARLILTQAYSAVTGACLAVRRALYLELGGLNETDFAIAYNDVDFCLRLRERGYTNVYTPFAELYHYESKTRGADEHGVKRQRFAGEMAQLQGRWPGVIAADPFYNPNLTHDREDFSLAWPPRIDEGARQGAEPVGEGSVPAAVRGDPGSAHSARQPVSALSGSMPREEAAVEAENETPAGERADLTFWKAPPTPFSPIELFAGQWQSLQPEHALCAQGDHLSLSREDGRILKAIEVFGGVEGARVLELGPLEGRHSYTLLRRGAAEVIGIEGNARAFQRALAFKEALRLDRLRLCLGNFVPYLRECTDRFDLVVACGVLYHLESPLDTLADIARLAPRLYLWTHYYDGERIARHPGWQGRFAEPSTWQWRGLTVRGGRQRYTDRNEAAFCGGLEAGSLWLEKSTLRAVLELCGYEIIYEVDEPEQPNGPAIGLCARKPDAGN